MASGMDMLAYHFTPSFFVFFSVLPGNTTFRYFLLACLFDNIALFEILSII